MAIVAGSISTIYVGNPGSSGGTGGPDSPLNTLENAQAFVLGDISGRFKDGTTGNYSGLTIFVVGFPLAVAPTPQTLTTSLLLLSLERIIGQGGKPHTNQSSTLVSGTLSRRPLIDMAAADGHLEGLSLNNASTDRNGGTFALTSAVLTNSTTVTFTTEGPHNFLLGQSVVVVIGTASSPSPYDGEWTIASVPTINSFTVTVPTATTAILSAKWNSGLATYTLASPVEPPFGAGQLVDVLLMTPSGYNGMGRIVSSIDIGSFTVAIGTSLGNGGTGTVQASTPSGSATGGYCFGAAFRNSSCIRLSKSRSVLRRIAIGATAADALLCYGYGVDQSIIENMWVEGWAGFALQILPDNSLPSSLNGGPNSCNALSFRNFTARDAAAGALGSILIEGVIQATPNNITFDGGGLTQSTNHSGPPIQVFGGSLLSWNNIYAESNTDYYFPFMRIRGQRSTLIPPTNQYSQNVRLSNFRFHGNSLRLPFSLNFSAITQTGTTTTYTFTTTQDHGFVNGDVVVLDGFQATGFNGAWTVSNRTSPTFDLTLSSTPNTGLTWGRVSGPMHLEHVEDGGATISGKIATYHTSVPHTFRVGQQVYIEGVDVDKYNSSAQSVPLMVAAVGGTLSTHQFQVVLPDPPTAAGGTGKVRGVDPQYVDVDQCYGFVCEFPQLTGSTSATRDHPYIRLGAHCYGARIVLGPDVMNTPSWLGDPTVFCAGAGFNGNVFSYWDPTIHAWAQIGLSPSESIISATYAGPTQAVTPDMTKGRYFRYATSGTTALALTINAPTGGNVGDILTIDIRRSSLLSITTTWNAVYTLLTSWVNPAGTPNATRTIIFRYDGTNWREIARTPADVLN